MLASACVCACVLWTREALLSSDICGGETELKIDRGIRATSYESHRPWISAALIFV